MTANTITDKNTIADKKQLGLYPYQIMMLQDLILREIDRGGQISVIKDYIWLYDYFNDILLEENTINE
jgi:hypothetical protein